MKYDCVVFIHRLYFEGKIKKGGLDLIVDYLLSKNKKVLLFEFPLDYRQSTKILVSALQGSAVTPLVQFNTLGRISVINWLCEFFFAFGYTLLRVGKSGLVITSDPLTTFSGLVLRKFGFFKYHYYHSVDYSTDRFANPLLNWVYTQLLILGLRSADLVGFVTLKAKERLSQFSVKNMAFIPNSPDFHSLDSVRLPPEKHQPFSLVVTCSDVAHKYLIHELIVLTNRLKNKFPEVVLHIIGNTDRTDEYFVALQKYIANNALETHVVFHGHVSREENYKILANSYVGLAFYDGLFSHVIYGDALKIREYCALGLPSVADDHTYTAIDMAKNGCGFCLKDISGAEEKIAALFTDTTLYQQMSSKSLEWAAANDKRKILDDLFTNIIKL
jgi:glycosyltransferase involved in cell wall biosynthesis